MQARKARAATAVRIIPFLVAGLLMAGPLAVAGFSGTGPVAGSTLPGLAADNPNPPASTVKLVFLHHSVGDDWLHRDMGDLGNQLGANNYYVSDTYYDWGPDGIGSRTDIGNWWEWFRGPDSSTYSTAVYQTGNRHADYTRPMADPGGENQIILFKSCYPNSHLGGGPNDPPVAGPNPLRGEDSSSSHHTVGNAKSIYNDILQYFATRQDKLFVVITAPPLVPNETDTTHAANARAFNDWLVHDWLDGYPHHNVAVFDFYNVQTSNGGDRNTHDLGRASGNHHRWWNGAVQHIQTVAGNMAAYGQDPYNSHPSAAGGQKATAEFVRLLNVFYHRWAQGAATPTPTATSGPLAAGVYLPLMLVTR
jgi:hypothetical protein